MYLDLIHLSGFEHPLSYPVPSEQLDKLEKLKKPDKPIELSASNFELP